MTDPAAPCPHSRRRDTRRRRGRRRARPGQRGCFIDFLCPFRRRFELSSGPRWLSWWPMRWSVSPITPMNFLDKASMTNYSTHAAAASGCAAGGGRFVQYAHALVVSQPPESSPGLSDAELSGTRRRRARLAAIGQARGAARSLRGVEPGAGGPDVAGNDPGLPRPRHAANAFGQHTVQKRPRHRQARNPCAATLRAGLALRVARPSRRSAVDDPSPPPPERTPQRRVAFLLFESADLGAVADGGGPLILSEW